MSFLWALAAVGVSDPEAHGDPKKRAAKGTDKMQSVYVYMYICIHIIMYIYT